MMANHSQRKLIPLNSKTMQMFAEDDDIPVDDDLTDDIPQDDDIPADNLDDNPADDEEFDEITYNKETVKIPKSDRKTFLQKGYNYDKVHGKLTETEQKITKLQELTGMDLDKAIESLEQQLLVQEAKRLAQETGKPEEDVQRELVKDRRLQAIENELKATKLLANLEKEKAPFKDKLYFKELEPEIDQLVKDNALQGREIGVEAAFQFLRGQKLEELMEKTKGNAVKKTLADVQDRLNRGITSDGDGTVYDGADTVDVRMAQAFGNDPKEIAQYKKSKLKELR